MGSRLSVGIDLVSLDEVNEAMQSFGEQYLRRVFTDDELRESHGEVRALAERFAAKEAVTKALAPAVGESVPWRSIGVSSGPGSPSILLTGKASDLARRRGISHLEVGLTRAGALAGAVAVAYRAAPESTAEPT